MRVLQAVLLLVVAGGAVAFRPGHTSASQQPTASAPQQRPPTPAEQSPNQEINNRFVKQFMERIAGRQNEPAEQVFKNIQWLKGVPAQRFLVIMNRGYSRAVGVACTHCHVEEDFASDDKRPKRAAREMAAMHRMINEQLRKIQNLETEAQQRAINCSTCHRGAINPLASDR